MDCVGDLPSELLFTGSHANPFHIVNTLQCPFGTLWYRVHSARVTIGLQGSPMVPKVGQKMVVSKFVPQPPTVSKQVV